ncbi:hypothetical protein HMPREF3201_01391 [Megasphaera sp. MJR8396C]|nr:hypothetical protein HMPREF3201_01391 [Megasphaera sp. MJR8396C]
MGFMAQFVISLYRSFIGFVNLGYDGEIIFFRKFDLLGRASPVADRSSKVHSEEW